MMYFVYHLSVYKPRNKACSELQEFIGQYEYILIKDECSLDALASTIEAKIAEINKTYAKLMPISFMRNHSLNRISASVLPPSGNPDYVFIMDICRVRSTFQYSENTEVSSTVLAVPGVCRICGCTDNDPCFHPDYGMCWWADNEHTICSHCAEEGVKDDPRTKHCINTCNQLLVD